MGWNLASVTDFCVGVIQQLFESVKLFVMLTKLTDFAAEQQRSFDTSTSAEDRKRQGHFGTPASIAQFMAALVKLPTSHVRVLDPGAGVGILSAAICERVLREGIDCSLEFELWENDPRLEPILRRTMTQCQDVLRAAGHMMEFDIHTEDFILGNSQPTLFDAGPVPSFHLAILNPPYFKLAKESPQARSMSHVVHGQPNIYALFMARAADLLLPGGDFVAITPRSYFNGPYFKRFRKWFFDRAVARQIHVFESRADAFRDDSVLQENVILHAEIGDDQHDITITTSHGRDMTDCESSRLPYCRVIDDSCGDHVIRVSSSQLEDDVISAMDSLPCRFRELGFEISTGPVVTFRSMEFLRESRGLDTAPLLWMHNVRPFVTQFPEKNGKPAHIAVCDQSRRLLVPASRFVLLKRFTSKEEQRRLVAGIMNPDDSYSEWVGLENHLNYIYRRQSPLTVTEAFGLAGFFNSGFVDRYFRAISGNTQVNATEIRTMPFPDEETLNEIGSQILSIADRCNEVVDRIVASALHLPEALLNELIETSQ